MKRIIAIILAIFIISLGYSQNRLTPPSKVKSTNKETNVKSNNKLSKKTSTPHSLISNIETINGITVKWNGVTLKQKTAITELLNNMVFVEGGDYDSNVINIEKPVLYIKAVSSFRIDKYEVTQKLWEAVMGNNPSYFEGENLPVENVTWDKCQDFIKKLNRLTGLSFRMPTEAEWEYAARGGNLSKSYNYSGSNTIENVAWYGENSGNKTHPVGTKSPNELGLYDMSGNVYEWTSDKYSSDYNSPRNSSSYVYRGGGWSSIARYSRVTFRNFNPAAYRGDDLGFRLVL